MKTEIVVGQVYLDPVVKRGFKWPWEKTFLDEARVLKVTDVRVANSPDEQNVSYNYVTPSGVRGTGTMVMGHAETLIAV